MNLLKNYKLSNLFKNLKNKDFKMINKKVAMFNFKLLKVYNL